MDSLSPAHAADTSLSDEQLPQQRNGLRGDEATGTDIYDKTRPSGQVIGISFCRDTPLLWRVAELKTAREEFGVIGSLVGSLARQPRQNVRLGRPLELLNEEAQLLSQTGKAVALRNVESEEEEGNSEAVQRYQAYLDRNYEEQKALALEDKKAVLQRVKTERHNCNTGGEDVEKAVQKRLDSLDKSFSFPRSAMAIQLCTARAGLSHCPEERSFLAADWPMPQDARSQMRFGVFRDLRRRGFYLSSAGKFGGDYLVYPGDPLRFHAHFIAVCVSMDAQMQLYDILSIARLGSNVKKTVLLCSPGNSEEEEEVVYTSLQWSGMA
ncbi:tRNA-splicing endonuclease subunit Sen34 [Chanos chanos]|uniref:tRNA-splicing endonuclease subunit Sen34 n=1 Tax=Chanos chanos TaxID=29144 RepID=A0A6J2UU16_CHACN|nr:tRNA-splicing endonuclease subunit Sen34 [Chanos chanos]